jgi:hypothetical protein
MNDDHKLHNPNTVDADLRARFAVLRREEQPAPEFASLWRRRPNSSRGRALWLMAAACGAIVLAAIVWQSATPRRPHDLSVASITEWKAPTDFLLETPGRELLRTVPQIGEWPGYTATAPQNGPATVRKKASH